MGIDNDNEKVNEDGNVKENDNGENERETGDRPITILRNTLRWGHLCPTAPGKIIEKKLEYLILGITFIILPLFYFRILFLFR